MTKQPKPVITFELIRKYNPDKKVYEVKVKK